MPQRPPRQQRQITRRLPLCIDLGTTYSSVVFYELKATAGSVSRDALAIVLESDLQSIRNYPGARHFGKISVMAEVPSELYYGEDKTHWGYEVHHIRAAPWSTPGTHVERFKLMLDRHERTAGLRKDVDKTLKALGKEPEDVMTDYLTKLLNHTRDQLEMTKRLGSDIEIDLVACVPAIWDDVGLTITTRAIKKAADIVGLPHSGEVYLVSEPDAAATFFSETYQHAFEAGETVLACDAGGGTVDIVSYTILSTSPTRLQEAVPGDGACCGSSYITDNFRSNLSSLLKKQRHLESFSGGITQLVGDAVWDFETRVKRDYEGSKDEPKSWVRIPGLKADPENPDINDGMLTLQPQFLRDLFEPQLEQIVRLIRDQIVRAEKNNCFIKRILLVGGFAASPALHIRIMEEFPQCEVYKPDTPDTAIARGGLLRFLNRHFGIEQFTPASYGFIQKEEFSEEAPGHINAVTEEDAMDGKLYVPDCVSYFVHKNERIPAGGKTFATEGPLHRTISSLKEPLQIWFDLYSNSSDEDLMDHFPLLHSCNAGCILVGTLQFEISPHQLKASKPEKHYIKKNKKESPGNDKKGDSTYGNKAYWIVKYCPLIKIEGRNIQYELWFNNELAVVGRLDTDKALESGSSSHHGSSSGKNIRAGQIESETGVDLLSAQLENASLGRVTRATSAAKPSLMSHD